MPDNGICLYFKNAFQKEKNLAWIFLFGRDKSY